MIKNSPIYFYIIASIVALIASIMDNEWLMLLSKPSIIPALFIYYFSSKRNYTSIILIVVLLIYFVSDTLALLDLNEVEQLGMVIDFIPYLLLLKVVIEDTLKLRFSKNEFLICVLAFSFLMIIMYFLIDSLGDANKGYSIIILTYGVVLAFYVTISLYNHLLLDSDFSMYILIAAIFGLIADIIYIITTMIFYVESLGYIEFALQIISYFYIVTYFIKRNRNKQLLQSEVIV